MSKPSPQRETLRPESVVVTAGRPHEAGDPVNVPIVPVGPYRATVGDNKYARHDLSPTTRAFEDAIGELEGGSALAFASGMAAITAVVESRPAGTVAVVPDAAYSGAVAIFAEQEALGRMKVRRVDVADADAVIAASVGADLVWLETITNPLMAVPDVPAIAEACRANGALLCVDSTFSTPLIARPFDLGADVVMHSATKYLAGHSDVLMGLLITRSPELYQQLHIRRTNTGAIPGTLESYLATRGLRTLALRIERAQANAADLAGRLSAHPDVTRVRYPGLPDDPGHAIAERDHHGFGAMLAFEVGGGAEQADRLCAKLQLITHATSLGGVESLIERRAMHDIDAGFGTPHNLLRLSVGIEHVDDLWADLEQALAR